MAKENSLTVVTPVGCIGNRGVDKDALREAVGRHKADVIAVDAGSIDCGPWYLGAGKEHSPAINIRWDIEAILDEAIPNGLPVVIGSAGGSGAKAHVDKTVAVMAEVAKAKGHHFKLAVIYSDIDKSALLKRAEGGFIKGSRKGSDGSALSVEAVEASETIVGAMGVEPIIEAFEAGANVVLAGRAVDAAVIAAYPIYRGFDRGLAYHMGDIMECAESAAEEIRPTLRGLTHNRIPILGRISEHSFSLWPARDSMACTPQSCLMHAMYERTEVERFRVPGGLVDRSRARYEPTDENTTRVSGTTFVPEPKSILFEGVRKSGYRSLFIFGVRTGRMIAQLDQILAENYEIERQLFKDSGNFKIFWHKFGQNAVLQESEPETASHEVGVTAEIVADTQELAHDVAYDLLTRIAFWRYPGRYTTAGNVGITFSPGVFDVGPAYEFTMYHAVPVDDYGALFRREMIDL